MGTAPRCVRCGAELKRREQAAVEADLGHVRWALEDAAVWDASVVTPSMRAWVLHRFRMHERALVGCLVPEVKHVMAAAAVEPVPALDTAPAASAAAAAARQSARDAARKLLSSTVPLTEAVSSSSAVPPAEVAVSSSAGPSSSAAASASAASASCASPRRAGAHHRADLEAPRPSAEERVVEAASSWNRFWRPFLNESVGWFIGAFLILAGTFYFVADVWTDLGAEGRALLVFAGTAVWTCGFFAWARFLFRREVTRSAGRILKLIAAVIAPLPTVALWPLAERWPLAFWPLLGFWALVAAQLAREVAREYDPRSSSPLAFGMASTAAMMGLAPLAAQLGSPILWLCLAPLLALALAAKDGPREGSTAQVFSMLAPLYLLGLFAARLSIALVARQAMPPFATLAAFGAAALALLLELREAPVRKAADPFAVVVVALQLGLAVVSVWGEAPAFFVTCAMGAVTTARLAQRGPSEASARWLYGTYALAYFAWQACGQLVPGVLVELLAALKEALGYAPSQPLPASYNAVYAAAFVVAVGSFALWRARSAVPRLRASAPVLLRASVVTSVLVAAMALPVVASDARPAVFSLPFVAALCLAVAARESRRDAAWAGALLLALSVVGAAFLPGVPAALALGLGALLAAGLSLRAPALSLAPLSLAAGALAAATAVAAFATPAAPLQVAALVLALAAGVLVARNTGAEHALEAALALFPLAAARAVQCVAPQAALLGLAVAAAALAALALRGGRAAAARPVAVGFALGGAAVALVLARELDGWLVPTLLSAAGALALADPRRWPGAVAIAVAALGLAALPVLGETGLALPALQLALGVSAAGLSAFWAWRHDRSWHAGVLALCGAGLAAEGALWQLERTGQLGLYWLGPAAALLLAGRALLPWVTLPFAAVCLVLALPISPPWVCALAVAVAAAGLLERWEWGRAHLLGGARLAWCASAVSSLLFAVVLVVREGRGSDDPGTLTALAVAALAVPLFSVAATRHALPALLLAPFLGGAARIWGGSAPALLAPLAVLAVSRLAAGLPAVRAALGLGERRLSQLQWLLAGPLAVVALLAAAFGGADLAPAALAVALCAARPLSVRLALAAVLLVLAPEFAAAGALALLALAFFAFHAPRVAQAVLGGPADDALAPVAAVAALLLAAWAQPSSGGSPAAAVALPAALAGAALLLRQGWLLSFAVAAVAFPVGSMLGARGLHVDAERALAVALFAAAGALALLSGSVAERFKAAARWLSKGYDADLRPWLWWGAAATATLSALGQGFQTGAGPGVGLLAVAALLAFTRARAEAVGAAALLGLGAWLAAPAGWEGVAVGALGLTLCAGGLALVGRLQTARAWHLAGLGLAVLALACCGELRHLSIALTWSLAAAAGWLAARAQPQARWAAWLGTLGAAHVVLFWGGLTLSHGAPRELILPWVGAASLLLGALALLGHEDPQRTGFGYAAAALGLLELASGLVLLAGPWPREALVATVGAGALLAVLARRTAVRDSAAAPVVGQVGAALLWASWHVYGLGGGSHALDGLALLILGAAVSGLAVLARRVERPGAAVALSAGAYGWPLLGLLVAVRADGSQLGLLLLACAAHFAWLGQAGRWRRAAAVLSAGALNLALLTLWMAAGWSSAYYLFIAAGLSAVVLVKLFEADLGAGWAARLRAAAAATIYAAAAWKPLAFDTTWALWVCVLVCVLGVAAGIALKVRSYVYLGTAFLVTSVLSNLIRFGVREPRVGALLLSTLGLAVVAFMVVVTTRRSELLQRYQRVQTMLQAWEA